MIHKFKHLGDIDLTVPTRRTTDPQKIREMHSTLIFALSMLEHAYSEVASEEELSNIQTGRVFAIDWGQCSTTRVPLSLYLILNTRYRDGSAAALETAFNLGPAIRRYLTVWYGLDEKVLPVQDYNNL